MGIGLVKLLRFLETPSTGLFLLVADNDSGVAPIAVSAPATGNSLTLAYPGGTLARKEYQLGTRVVFTAVSFTSNPQVSVNEVLHVVARTATTINLSQTPAIPGTTPAQIEFTGAGAATIRDLNAVETVAGELSEAYTVVDAVRYEKDLGLTPNERPAWSQPAITVGIANPASGDTSLTKRAISQLTEVASISPPGDIDYTALIYIESDTAGGTAVNTLFDTNGIVHHIDDATDTILGGSPNSMRTEYSLIPA